MSMNRLIEAAEIEALSEMYGEDLRPFSEATDKGVKAIMKVIGDHFEKKDRSSAEGMLYGMVWAALRDVYKQHQE